MSSFVLSFNSVLFVLHSFPSTFKLSRDSGKICCKGFLSNCSMLLKLFPDFKNRRKRRRVLLIFCPCFCLALFAVASSVIAYENERVRLTEEILRTVGHSRNTSAKVLPLFTDTTLLHPSHGCQSCAGCVIIYCQGQFSGRNALAIILVPSMPGNRANRERIRTTWGKYRFQEGMHLFFLVGKSHNGKMAALSTEAERHGDIIIDDLEENYYALPIKILRGLKWFVNNCPSAQFLIKVDEDVVLNLPKFATELRAWPEEYQLGGHIIKDGIPHVWNPFIKWFVPQELWSGRSVDPDFLEGPCYAIRGDVVPMILQASYKTPLYHLEDVFITGMIANERLKLKLMKFKGIVKKTYLYWWYLQRYFFDLCNFTSLHTDQNYVMFMKIFNRCEDFVVAN